MSLDGVNGFLDVESAALRAPQVGIANTNPQHILSVGSNLYVSGDSSDVLTVDGNVVCEGVKVGLIEITPSYDLEAVANVGNSTSNTILFTNPDTGIVATGNVSVGKTLTVDGIRITAAAEADVDLDAVVAAGPSTARSIQLIGATDSISPVTGTLTIGTNLGDFGGLGVAGNVHVGRGLYVDTDTLVADSTTNRVGIGKTNPDATLDVDGDAIIRGDLSVLGTTTTIDTENLRVQDPIIELGKDNAGTGDLGLVMTRPTGSSNVAIIFDENADTLEIGYTDNDASATDITMVSTPLSVNINGDLSITSNLEVSGNINGDLSVTSNLEVGTANLFVDTVDSRVGIGTNDPVSGLTVFRDIESSNSFITERVLFRETWPNGLNSLVGDLGTWVVTNLNQQTNPGVETTPDGYGIVAFNGGTGVANGEFVSPAFDLSDYAIVDGNHQADDKRKTTTRVFMKFWLGTRQLDSNGEVLQVQFSPDNGTTWYTVATSQDRLSTDRFTMVSADLSPYILETSTQAKIRFYLPWTVGEGDYIRIGRIWIHESDVPTNLGGMWLGAGGNIGIGTTNPQVDLEIENVNGSPELRFTDPFSGGGATWDARSNVLGEISWYSRDSQHTNSYGKVASITSKHFDDGWPDGALCFTTSTNGFLNEDAMVIDHTGNVGIGTTNPIARLHDPGDLAVGNVNGDNYNSEQKAIYLMRGFQRTFGLSDRHHYISTKTFNTTDGNQIIFYLDDGTTSDGTAHVATMKLDGTGHVTVAGSVYASSQTLSSDDRIKYNEQNISDALTIISQLKPQKYEKLSLMTGIGTWIPTDEEWENVKEDYKHGDEFGFIAQDIKKIPELSFLVHGEETRTDTKTSTPEEYSNLTIEEQVTYTPSYVYESNTITQEEYSNLTPEEQETCTVSYTKQIETQTPLALNYQGLFVVAIGAIKELKAKNDTLETQLASVLARLDTLENA